MVKITKRLCIVLTMSVLIISFSIPFTLFPSKVYADETYTVGQEGPAGGIIFYKVSDSSGGWSYLEAALSDQSTGVSWSNITTEIGSAAQEQAIGTGQSNTAAIVGQADCTSGAAYLCYNLSLNGYDDWFLPSKDELNQMYINRVAIGGFAADVYWSSSEQPTDSAYRQNMDSGAQGSSGKFNAFHVRAIRAFSVPSGASPSKPLTPQEQVMLNLSFGQQSDLYGRTNAGFVKMLYDNILGRVPDDEGLNNWAKDLNNGMPPADVVYYFVFSDELKPKIAMMSPEEFVNFLYKNVFNREPDSNGYNNWVSLMENGMSKENTLMLFLNCDEFKNTCNMFGTTQ